MESKLPSLITPDAKAGLALAAELATELQSRFSQANGSAEHPGGTSYGLPASVPKEVIGSVLFYAIAAANCGWASKG